MKLNDSDLKRLRFQAIKYQKDRLCDLFDKGGNKNFHTYNMLIVLAAIHPLLVEKVITPEEEKRLSQMCKGTVEDVNLVHQILLTKIDEALNELL